MGHVERRIIAIDGVVQGVGFRPFVFREATARGLRGEVRNDGAGVRIDVEGDPAALATFVDLLSSSPPSLARCGAIDVTSAALAGHDAFVVAVSAAARGGVAAPDVATCEACRRELFDPADRRYRYPFLSCTQCGPRLTVLDTLPWDRERTAMAAFPMCAACRAEYDDPADRRFHAQTTACPACGPRVALCGPDGTTRVVATPEAALTEAVALLREGRILAIKGLGGFHLACDATNDGAVRRLRERKHREAKPLAVMVADLAAAGRLCEVDPAAARLLESAEAPIVLLPSRPGAAVSAAVAPGRPDLGLMLPYTPLHHLLCRDADGPLVMTSGNRSDEPMAASDDEARVCLAGIADAFLVHDRRIATRCDDSVVRVLAGAPSFVRRSRGWAPGPIRLAFPVAEPVLATGGHLKNTFCIARGDAAYVSHHIGDLEGVDAFLALREGIDRHTRLLGVAPDIVAYDLHPDYLSTKLALELPAAQRIAVQHHYAHVVACAAEHGVADPVLGVAFDGTGLGTDGAVWGGEFLVADAVGFERVAHLDYVPLPGGEAAIRHPLRMAASYLFAAFGEDMASLDIAFVDRLPPGEWPVLRSMLRRGVQSPPTSSVGRLFDAVSALLGVQTRARYEGEAAMALEAAADPAIERAYAFEVRETADGWIAEPASVLRAIVADMVADRAVPDMAAAFHNALRDLIVDVAVRVRRRNGIRRVALTGGVFQNRLLVERVAAALSSRGFEVLLHRQVPCNDGGLALGQACIAAAVAGGSVGGRAVRSRAVRAAPTAVVTGHR